MPTYSYTFALQDKLSNPMQKIAASGNTAYGKLNRGQQRLNDKMKESKRNAEGLKSSFKTMATRFITIAGGIALARNSLMKWDEQAQAEAQVMQGIESTGNAAGLSFERLKKAAQDLQKNTVFGDESIMKNVTAQFQTFTNITGNNFLKLQETALDVTSRLHGADASGESLKSTSIMLGKALNDPVANLGALSRAGIQFSDQQTQMIKDMWKGGEQAKAQGIILNELQKQYGGSAEAAAKAGLGPWRQFMNRMGDFMEKLGPILLRGVNLLMDFVNWIERNASTLKTLALVVGSAVAIYKVWNLSMKAGLAIQAAYRSAIIATSILTQGWTVIQKSLNAAIMANPVGFIIAGLVALGGVIIWAWNKFENFRGAILGAWEVMKGFGDIIKSYVIDRIKGLISGIGSIATAFKELFDGNWGKAWDAAKEGVSGIAGVDAKRNALKSGMQLGDRFNQGFEKGKDAKKKKLPFQGAMSGAGSSGLAGSGVGAGTNGLTGDGQVSAGMGSSADVKSGITGITGGGSKSTNVNISLNNLIETFNINSENVSEGVDQMREMVTEQLLRVLNSSNKLSTQQ
jgi:hypothetical protein